MAIRVRQDTVASLDKNKLVRGEFALDGGNLYFCYSAGDVKALTTVEDLQTILDATPTAYAALQELIADLGDATVLSGILADISDLKTGKLAVNGNSLNNVVTFTEAVADVDIATGDSHGVLFGKILKRFNAITTALGLKQTIANMVQNDTTNDATKYPSAAVAYIHGLEIDALNLNAFKNRGVIGPTTSYASLLAGTYNLSGIAWNLKPTGSGDYAVITVSKGDFYSIIDYFDSSGNLYHQFYDTVANTALGWKKSTTTNI